MGHGAFEQIIKEFATCDPKSFAFRYPIKKDGTPSLPQNFAFDPVEFARTLDPVLDALLGGCTGLEVYIDTAHEAMVYDQQEASEVFAQDFDVYPNHDDS